MTIPENLLQKKSQGGRQIVTFRGNEAYLAGIYPNVQKLDGVAGDQSSIAAGNVDFGPNMQLLARHTNNFFRHWVIFYPNFVDAGPEEQNYPNIDKTIDPTTGKPKCTEIKPSVTSAGQPWRERYSPFLYNRALDKWDLWRYNEDYFLRLKKMIKTAYDYGIIVQLTLFDRTGIDFVSKDKCLRWPYSPWNAKHNVNKVINDPDNGVSAFYDRNLKGEIRFRTVRGLDREHWQPEPGPNVVTEEITLGELQDLYVEKVVTSTVEYPNVCYEIMNEPTGGGERNNIFDRVRWADTILGVINKWTEGKRFIFYNDLSSEAKDINQWQEKQSTLQNYGKLDGVIFHGNVLAFDISNLNEAVRGDKIIQLSTDTYTNQTTPYNKQAAEYAFAHHMIFQAEAIFETAADGIGSARQPPTLLNLPPLVATWIKVSENPPSQFPHLFYTQRADGTMLTFNPDDDKPAMQGRVIEYDSSRLVFWTGRGVRKDRCVLQDGNQQLVLTDGDWTQVYKRYQGALSPFFYQWEKVSESPTTQVPMFYLFIYPDNSVVARRVDTFGVIDRAHVIQVTASQISFHSDTHNNDNSWNYRFTNHGQQLTLEKIDHSWTQVFRRSA